MQNSYFINILHLMNLQTLQNKLAALTKIIIPNPQNKDLH